MVEIEYAYDMKAFLGGIDDCGDLAIIKNEEYICILVLIDVLGHGREARSVALAAEKCLENRSSDNPMVILDGLHNCLKGSRGAVVSICTLHKESGLLTHSGIGNISVRIFGPKPMRLVSRDGIVGYGTIKAKENQVRLMPGDILMLHSDGIKEHFDTIDCACLLMEDAKSIVKGIMGRYRRNTDDASCIVLKFVK